MARTSNKEMVCARRYNVNNEFYTQYETVEEECDLYKEWFKDKHVYCNCDTVESSFVRYFSTKSVKLSFSSTNFSFMENLDLLDECDVVVTNPPFSLFLTYVKTLLAYNKDFLILGNNNALIYQDIFPLIVEDKIRLGYHHNFYPDFILPDGSLKRVSGISWFTTLPVTKPYKPLPLTLSIKNTHYEYFDNMNLLNVNRLKDIPYDYFDTMAVPITYLNKHHPQGEFDIVGYHNGGEKEYAVNGKKVYGRVHIRRKI